MAADDSSNLVIYDYKQEAQAILSNMDTLYKARNHEIQKTFDHLFSNLPLAIKSMPMIDCLETYLNFIRSEDSYIKLLQAEKTTTTKTTSSHKEAEKTTTTKTTSSHKEAEKPKEPSKSPELSKKPGDKTSGKEVSLVEIIDDSVIIEEEDKGSKCRVGIKPIDANESKIDFETFSKFDNLTSTVKKANPIKSNLKILSDKMNSMLCEEMAIPKDQETDQVRPNDAATKDKTQVNEMTVTTPEDKENPDFALKLVYYLQDGTEARVNLKDLKSIKMDKVHSACVNELKMAIINNS